MGRIGVMSLVAHDPVSDIHETGAYAIQTWANQGSGDGSDGHPDRNGDDQAAERCGYKHLSAPSIVRTV
jgi:hypothetical protein